ncbi:lytic transglycosylase domain-containing protein [Primorskyibacter sp. S187A]|uniref:lytic transglycosylase domain-containing protein n=1 Tax=Primorskyibacter sp. S187A TaxID=3415130 RepID=UPI003C7A75C9
MPLGLTRFFLPFLAAGLFGVASPLQAESPPPFPDFKAKRIKPPKSGAGKRITVQIAPQEAPAPQASAGAERTEAAAAPRGARYPWFWEVMSPSLEDSGPGRLEPALVALRNAPDGVASPRLQSLQDIARQRGVDILKASIGTDVSPALVLAVISVESAGRVDAVSKAGAQGLMQLMPATAARFDVTNALAASENIRGGVAYLDWLMKEFDRDPLMVLAAYNAGEGAVRKHKGVPPFAETRDYVPKVLAAFTTAKGLCRTPPQLITDGCVFTVMN